MSNKRKKEVESLGQWTKGMRVLVSPPATSMSSEYLSEIEAIYDNETFKVKGLDQTFLVVSGFQKGGGSWSHYHVTPATDADRERITLRNRHYKLQHFNFTSLTPEQASEIVLFMREKGITI